MKFLSVLAFAVAVCVVNASPVVQEDILGVKLEDRVYPRFIEFTDAEGNMHTIDLEAEPELDALEAARNPNNNEYHLYTRRNRILSQELTLNNANSVRNSNFNPNVETIVLAHGWLGNRRNDLNPGIRSAYLDKRDVNMISLDWSRLASSLYNTAANGVPAVGRGLGQFVRFLSQTSGAPLSSFHLVGFSLGAHLVGSAGRELGGQLPRITGLDPAGPGWVLNRDRLSSSDARYVEAIHTDGGYTVGGLGIGSAIVDVDFFPNGGISQPGCYTNLCNHNRAFDLFAATVSHNHHVGRRCTTSTQVTWNTCIGAQLPMGNDDIRKTGSGMYRLDTGRRHPY